MKVMVTGASGFVGYATCARFVMQRMNVVGTVRHLPPQPLPGVDYRIASDVSKDTDWYEALKGVNTVVHCAARVHVMREPTADPLQEFRRINVGWTGRLAQLAALQGVRRFVYLSSIKVNGEQTVVPFTEQDPPNPQDAYGVSKWEAEQALAQVSTQTGMEIVIVRSPLVYGPGVRGNFLQLLNILRRGIPLPLASIRNQRSFVYLGNLVDALGRCIQDPRAARQTYLVCDSEDVATPELVRRLGAVMGSKVCLWPCPTALLYWMGQVAGRRGMIDRLVGSLQVNSSKIQTELGWHPPFTVDVGLSETAAWFHARTTNQVAAS
jgi:nucleoside-diphosphate-sugar epimerase